MSIFGDHSDVMGCRNTGFAISKANVSFTPPTPKTGLAYTGETQDLINAATVDASIGKLTYSLSETGTYSETIPTTL